MAKLPYKGWTSPNYAFDKRRGIVERGLAQQVRVYDQVGTTQISLPTSGGLQGVVTAEALVTITFTQTFIEKPVFTFGSELSTNQAATSGSFPQLSATVHRWVTSPAGYSTLYEGAVLGVVASGALGLAINLHYSFSGKCTSPLVPAYNDTGTA